MRSCVILSFKHNATIAKSIELLSFCPRVGDMMTDLDMPSAIDYVEGDTPFVWKVESVMWREHIYQNWKGDSVREIVPEVRLVGLVR